MKHSSLVILCIFFAFSISAQTLSSTSVSSSGGTFTNSTASLSFTIGQVAASTFVKSNSILTQGFQQGDADNSNGVITLQSKFLNVGMYPNPASSFIAFSIYDSNYAFADITIYNSLGVKMGNVESIELTSPQEQIHHTENLSDGVYFAVISVKNSSNGQQEVLTQKFTIIN